MQIQQLTYFVAIAEQGSINKAAEKLFVTQPNLSKAISNLENELKVRIFNRTNKGVALTDEGKKLYQYARTIINQMELIQGLSEKEHAPVLSIASYPIITMGVWWRSSTTITTITVWRSSWWKTVCSR